MFTNSYHISSNSTLIIISIMVLVVAFLFFYSFKQSKNEKVNKIKNLKERRRLLYSVYHPIKKKFIKKKK